MLQGGGEKSPQSTLLRAIFFILKYMEDFLENLSQIIFPQVGVIFFTIMSRDHCLYDVISPTSPEVIITRLLDHIETRFEVLILCFRGRAWRWYTPEHGAT